MLKFVPNYTNAAAKTVVLKCHLKISAVYTTSEKPKVPLTKTVMLKVSVNET